MTDMWLFILGIAVLLLLCGNLVFLLLRKHNNQDIQTLTDILFRGQAELAGRISQLSEAFLQRQQNLTETLNEQKLSVLKLMNDGLRQSADKTTETMSDLRERLVKIDAAQQKISQLSEQVVSLQEILANKQARGAFGEIQLNDLVKSVLPPSVYDFQHVLGNQKRADCVLRLPNPPGTIVIDSKFPLESYQALRRAQTEREKIEAERFFRSSVLKHIKDIAEKYIIPGETAESALMFLPSESVYAELYTNFTDVVAVSYRAKVWIVSPTTLMATLNTVRAILKDAAMSAQTGIMQKEIGLMIEDVSRLKERTENLSRHFENAAKDIDDILISADKIAGRIDKIENMQLSGCPSSAEKLAAE